MKQTSEGILPTHRSVSCPSLRLSSILALVLFFLVGCASGIPVKRIATLKAGETFEQVSRQLGTEGKFKCKVVDGRSRYECRRYGNSNFLTFRDGRLLGQCTQADPDFDFGNPVRSSEMRRRIISQFRSPKDIRLAIHEAEKDDGTDGGGDLQAAGHFVAMIPFGSPAATLFVLGAEAREDSWSKRIATIPLHGSKADVLRIVGEPDIDLGSEAIWAYRRRGDALIGWEGNRVVFVTRLYNVRL